MNVVQRLLEDEIVFPRFDEFGSTLLVRDGSGKPRDDSRGRDENPSSLRPAEFPASRIATTRISNGKRLIFMGLMTTKPVYLNKTCRRNLAELRS